MNGKSGRETVLIGTYTSDHAGGSRGIYAADWDGEAGTLGAPRIFAEMEHPSFLAAHPAQPILYATSETGKFQGRDSGAVAFIRLKDGSVAHPSVPSGGTSPCHAAVSPRGDFLAVSNYGSGTVGAFALKDGLPKGEPVVLRLEGHGPNASRQEGPHAHSALFDSSGKRFYVQDLGTDRIWGFAQESGEHGVRPLDPPFVQLEAGSGPRHMVFHPRRKWAYLINELNNTVTVLSWERKRGILKPLQTVKTLPAGEEGESYCADIHVSPDGAYLYGSNRGHDSLAVWRVDPKEGKLTLVQHVSCGGAHPRNFTLSPDGRWLLCANMNSDNIVVFRRDGGTGNLQRISEAKASKPTCLVFMPADRLGRQGP